MEKRRGTELTQIHDKVEKLIKDWRNGAWH